MSSRRILVSEVAWPSPRSGSALTCSISSATVWTPSPITCGGSRRAAAIRRLPTTSKRKSLPGKKRSTIGWPCWRAARKAMSRCSRSVMLTVTPLPWLPSRGFTTTGRPMSCATAQASSALSTGWPQGTGTPAARSSCLVSSLSCAMLSATALVPSTSAAQMRRCLAPQPSCTNEPWVRRRNGMPRATAALTMAPVDGPMRMSSSSSRSSASTASTSNGCGSGARTAAISRSAAANAARPTASSVYSTTTWKVPGSTVSVQRAKLTGQPACACKASATRLSACANDRPSVERGQGSSWGKRSRRAASNSGWSSRVSSLGSQRTMASMAVWRVQRLGPRSARMREMSMAFGGIQ